MPTKPSLYDQFPRYSFVRPPEMKSSPSRYPVAIVGGGPVGLTLACALANYGVKTVMLQAADCVSFGSRALCISRRSLEIWDRFGLAEKPIEKGLAWMGGRSYWHQHQVLEFAMEADETQKHPPMINLQQCFIEQYLVDAARERPNVDLRWQSEVTGVEQGADHATLTVKTPEGNYDLEAEYVVAADGARSFIRQAMGLQFAGNSYEGRYLIADIKIDATWPVER